MVGTLFLTTWVYLEKLNLDIKSKDLLGMSVNNVKHYWIE